MGKYDDGYGVSGEQAPIDTTGKPPEGNYSGEFVSHELVTSGVKGTPGIKLVYNVDGIGNVDVNIWLSEASSEIAIKQLKIAGWNGEFQNCAFNPTGPVPLWMKYQTDGKYRGKPQWSVSSFEKKDPPNPRDSSLTKFAARFKALGNAAPAPAKPSSAPPPPKASAPPPPKAGGASTLTATTQDEAWSKWVEAGADKDGGAAFWKAVEDHLGHTDAEKVKPEEWNDIACMAPPF